MVEGIIAQSFAAFGAGLLSSLSPCVYPMIPISLGYLGSQTQENRRSGVVLFFGGQVVAFTGLGLAAVWLGEVFGFSSELPAINYGIGVLLLVLGAMSIFSYVPSFLRKLNGAHVGIEARFRNRYAVAFVVGVSSALLASPCTSPILGSVLVTLSGASSFLEGSWLMFLYALGMSLLFLGLGLGLLELKKLPRSGIWLGWVHRISSLLIICGGFYYLGRGFGLV